MTAEMTRNPSDAATNPPKAQRTKSSSIWNRPTIASAAATPKGTVLRTNRIPFAQAYIFTMTRARNSS